MKDNHRVEDNNSENAIDKYKSPYSFNIFLIQSIGQILVKRRCFSSDFKSNEQLCTKRKLSRFYTNLNWKRPNILHLCANKNCKMNFGAINSIIFIWISLKTSTVRAEKFIFKTIGIYSERLDHKNRTELSEIASFIRQDVDSWVNYITSRLFYRQWFDFGQQIFHPRGQ